MQELPKIAVLLSTYNGEKYLAEQLDSILQQSYSNYVIVVRDDGSKDDTVSLLRKYNADYPGHFHLIDRDSENKGASASFAYLIEYVLANKSTLGLKSAYMMFCDQDDIWLAVKIEKQVSTMLDAEEGAGSTIPVLVHSDLEVVSEKNTQIAESLIRYQGLKIERNRFPNLVICNLVTGCTALINEALAEQAVPVSSQAIMHDWWLAMVATAFGKLIFLDATLVRYRQHGSNTIGAKEFIRPKRTEHSFWRRLFVRKPNEHLIEVAIQAAEFRRRYGQQLSSVNNLGLRISACMTVKVGILQKLLYRLVRLF